MARLVLYGIGGIGKSTLAAQIAARLARLQPDQVIATITGEISPAEFRAGPREADVIVLDDFDHNLTREPGEPVGPNEPGGWRVANPELGALLATWTGKLLLTSRVRFALPGPPGNRLTFRRLGPLTRSGAAELASSLPGLRLLPEAQLDQAWRLTAGHPLALEYLDALLAAGESYADLACRITAAVQASGGQRVPRIEPTELPAPTAELVTSAAGDRMFGDLFGRLGSGARTLLVRASAFRLPVSPDALAARPGQIAECEAARLLTVGPGDELSVHRWTANQLHRRLCGTGQAAQLADAHRQAAGFWRSDAAGARAELEAAYHLGQARSLDSEPPAALRTSSASSASGASKLSKRHRRMRQLGAAGAAVALAIVLAAETTQPHPSHVALHRGHAAPHPAHAAPHPGHAVPHLGHAVPLSAAAAARGQAAAWVAREVSSGAILACDPAMCKALARGGVPDGNLLVLGPGASDPLGSDVVLATAALRGVFGGRLDSVYAPLVLASFGAGTARIDVRAVAPDGAAALRLALAGDLRARRAAGAELLRDPRLEFSASARAQVAAGGPDARLLITLAVLAAGERVQLLGFSDAGPGAGPDVPLRAAQLAVPASAAPGVLAFLRAQRPPYLAAHVSTAAGPGRSVLTIEFAAPSPLGLLNSKIKSSLSERTSVPPPEADPSLPSCTRPATCAATRAGDRCTHKESRSGAGGPAPGKGERDEHQPHLGLCRAEPGPGGRLRPGADGRAADGRAALRQRRSVRDPDGVPRGHRRAGGVDHVA